MGTRTKQGAVAALFFAPSAPVNLHRSFTNRFRKVRGRSEFAAIRASPKTKLEKLNASAALPCQWACPDSPLIRGLRISILQQCLGCWASQKLFEKKAASNWQLVLSQKGPVLDSWYLVLAAHHGPLPIGFGIGFGIGLGSPKGHASVTQGSIDGSAFVFNKSWKKAGWGVSWLKDAGRGS
jgi:hypothetical protein